MSEATKELGHLAHGTPSRPPSLWVIFDANGYRYTLHSTEEDALLAAERLASHKKPYEISEYILRTEEDVRKLNMHDGLVAACEKFTQGTEARWWTVSKMQEAAELATAALAQHAEPETETVELVVGDEYEIIKGPVPMPGPNEWVLARCVILKRPNVSGPLFQFELTPGDVVSVRRVKGEYRRKQETVEHAEAVT